MGVANRKGLDARVAGNHAEMPRHPRVEPLTLRRVLLEKPSKPITVQADATVRDVLRSMSENGTGAALVMDGDRMIGTFSERDYARNASETVATAQLRGVTAPCNASANVTDSVQDCLRLMREYRLQYLPVRDGEDLIALVSREDIQEEMISYLEQVFREYGLDQQIAFLRGTYSC